MERVNVFKYIPRDRYSNAQEILHFRDTVGNLFSDSFTLFFNNLTVKNAVIDNDWQKVFHLWNKGSDYGNRPGWVPEILADLLYFSNIDFWNYLPESCKLWLLFGPNAKFEKQ